ncbi:hypothetical protein HK096_008331, partial [Nowakowskiella sp. JEL0078]
MPSKQPQSASDSLLDSKIPLNITRLSLPPTQAISISHPSGSQTLPDLPNITNSITTTHAGSYSSVKSDSSVRKTSKSPLLVPSKIRLTSELLTEESYSDEDFDEYEQNQETNLLLAQPTSNPKRWSRSSSIATELEFGNKPSFLRRQNQQLNLNLPNSRYSWSPMMSTSWKRNPNATIGSRIWNFSSSRVDDLSPPARFRDRRLSLPISPLRRKSRIYDDQSIAFQIEQESVGMRTWYDDYTTIDWTHDHIKDKLRLRTLRSVKGIKGWLLNNYNAAEAWILIFIIGIICGVIAAGIQISQDHLSALKEGYCRDNYWHRKRICCESTENIYNLNGDVDCPGWVTWAEFAGVNRENPDDAYVFNYGAYVLFGILFAFLAALLVWLNPHRPEEPLIAPAESEEETRLDTVLRQRREIHKATSVSRLRPTKIIYHAAGSGIPEVKTILGGFVIRGFLGFRTLVVKVIGLSFSVSSGLNLGAQGPLVHICACVGNVASRLFEKYSRNEGKRREILSASCAAGVSVAFGAPIGGVLFSLEEVSYYFPLKTLWRTFFCALIAAVTLKSSISIIRENPVTEVILVTLITGTLNYLNPFTEVSNLELITGLFRECPSANSKNLPRWNGTTIDGWEGVLGSLCSDQRDYTVIYLLALCFASKFFLNILTFGLKIPAGIFIPTMVVGACVGRILGMMVLVLQEAFPNHPFFETCTANVPCVIPGVYAVVGAASALTGVTRMTVSLVVIMFELTGSLTYVLPLMLAIMVSKWIADLLTKGNSLFQLLIDANGHPYLDMKKDPIHTKSLSEVMEPIGEVIDVYKNYSVKELDDMLLRLTKGRWSEDGGFPIVEDSGVLVGYIAYNELRHALDIVKSRLTDENPCFFRRSHSFQHHIFGSSEQRNLRRESASSATSNNIITNLTQTRISDSNERVGTPTQESPANNEDIFLDADGNFLLNLDDHNDFTSWTDVAPLTLYNNSSMEMLSE